MWNLQRTDILLTMSEGQGLDYPNRNLSMHLQKPSETIEQDPELSVIGHVMHKFADTGVRDWSTSSAEWLLVYLLTELAATPYSLGYSAWSGSISVQMAFRRILQTLVSICPWQLSESGGTIKLTNIERSQVPRMGPRAICRCCSRLSHMCWWINGS